MINFKHKLVNALTLCLVVFGELGAIGKVRFNELNTPQKVHEARERFTDYGGGPGSLSYRCSCMLFISHQTSCVENGVCRYGLFAGWLTATQHFATLIRTIINNH